MNERNSDNLSDANADLQARLAFVYDAVLVAKTALERTLGANDSLFRHNFRHGELYNRGYPGVFCYPSADRRNPGRPFASFEHGRAIRSELHAVSRKTHEKNRQRLRA